MGVWNTYHLTPGIYTPGCICEVWSQQQFREPTTKWAVKTATGWQGPGTAFLQFHILSQESRDKRWVLPSTQLRNSKRISSKSWRWRHQQIMLSTRKLCLMPQAQLCGVALPTVWSLWSTHLIRHAEVIRTKYLKRLLNIHSTPHSSFWQQCHNSRLSPRFPARAVNLYAMLKEKGRFPKYMKSEGLLNISHSLSWRLRVWVLPSSSCKSIHR